MAAFSYELLDEAVAARARASAQRIRQKMKTALADVIAIGEELLDVKATLPHGQFGLWLESEFSWDGRTARHLMAVARRFGTNAVIISNMAIAPTAAYLLAAPSVSDEAVRIAVERAEAGERITARLARQIIDESKMGSRARGVAAPERLRRRLTKALEKYRLDSGESSGRCRL